MPARRMHSAFEEAEEERERTAFLEGEIAKEVSDWVRRRFRGSSRVSAIGRPGSEFDNAEWTIEPRGVL